MASHSGVNGSVTLGRGDWRKGKCIQGDGSHPVHWVQRRRPNRGSSGRIPQADTYYGNGCKTDILRRKNRKFIHVSSFS